MGGGKRRAAFTNGGARTRQNERRRQRQGITCGRRETLVAMLVIWHRSRLHRSASDRKRGKRRSQSGASTRKGTNEGEARGAQQRREEDATFAAMRLSCTRRSSLSASCGPRPPEYRQKQRKRYTSWISTCRFTHASAELDIPCKVQRGSNGILPKQPRERQSASATDRAGNQHSDTTATRQDSSVCLARTNQNANVDSRRSANRTAHRRACPG